MTTLSYPSPSGPAGENQWAVDLLEELGVTPTSTSAPDVLFVSAQEQHEGDQPGTAAYATEHNPLGLKGTYPGVRQSSTGVDEFSSAAQGLAATAGALSPSGPNAPYRSALTDPSSSLSQLETGLASSAWEGYPAGGSANQSYAKAVTANYAAAEYVAKAGNPNGNIPPGYTTTGTVGKSLSSVFSGLGGSIMKDVLTAIAAIAGLALIGAGLVKASSPDGKLPPASKLEEVAAA